MPILLPHETTTTLVPKAVVMIIVIVIIVVVVGNTAMASVSISPGRCQGRWEVAMSLSSNELVPSSVVANLYMQALRQGVALWFTVASGSMRPLLAMGDDIYIEPACAHQLCIGDIAAFETPQGLMVHRIVQRQQQKTTIRLLQMADSDLYPGWIAESDVIGRVVAIRRDATSINLRHPFVKQLGMATAYLRYWLSRCTRHDDPGLALHLCSRVIVHLQWRCIRWFCTSPLIDGRIWSNDQAFEQEKQYVTTE